MPGKPKLGCHLICPSVLDEIEVMEVAFRINLVAHDGKAKGGEVYPNLVCPARLRPYL